MQEKNVTDTKKALGLSVRVSARHVCVRERERERVRESEGEK